MSFLSVPKNVTVPLIVACSLFMEHLDSSIIATALPSMAESLKTDPLHLNLAITSYLFSLALFIPLSGWTADRFGARTVFRAAIVIFTLASMACGLSQSLSQIVTARLIQGMGGAMMVPVGRLVLLRTIDKSELMDAMAWFTAPALIGPVIGPLVGGFIVTNWTWHWIFFINLPIGLLGIYLVTKYIEDIKVDAPPPLDVRGFFLMAVALCGLVTGFETIGRHMLSSVIVGLLILTGTLFFTLYTLHARRTRFPIVDLALFRIPTFNINVIGGSLFRIGIGSLPFLMPLFFQIGFGLSAFKAGFFSFASSAGAVVMKLVATPLLRRFGFRNVLIHIAWSSNLLLASYVFLDPKYGFLPICLFLFATGFTRSIQFTALNTLAFADIPASHMSRATTLSTMMQQLSISSGVAIGALVLNQTIGDRAGTTLTPEEFRPAFWIVSFLSALSIFWFLRLKPDAGDSMSGHKSPKLEQD